MDNKTKLLIGGLIAGILVIAGLAYLVLKGISGTGTQQNVTLQMWGVFDDSSYFSEAIGNFEKTNPNIHVIYRKFNYDEYESQLLNSFAAGTGPDIWLMHNTWLPKSFNKIQPLPQTIKGQKEPLLTLKSFQDQFVDVTVKDLTANGQIYGLPLYVDTLALYYNRDLFNSVGITTPPKTYDELNDDVARLTQLDASGNISRSGIAMGTSRNINRSTDVLGMLMLQSGVNMTDSGHAAATFAKSVDSKNVGEVALQYYTDFANPVKQVYTWNPQQHYSIDAFANGETAMMLNYSHQIPVIRSKSARFNFAIASAPQIAGSPIAVSYADYWAPTVAKQSLHGIEAWKFLVYLSSAKGAVSYVNASHRPSARRDLIEQQKNDPDLGIFATQALTARSWYQVDGGAIEKIFAEMIDAVHYGRNSVSQALEAAENQVNVLMSKTRAQF